MTNREKFKEVYGFELEGSPCVAPEKVCDHYGECGRCPFKGWWDKEYLPEVKRIAYEKYVQDERSGENFGSVGLLCRVYAD